MDSVIPSARSWCLPRGWRSAAVGASAAALGALVLNAVPALRIEVFAAGAARIAAFLTGSELVRGDAAWLIQVGDRTVAVTEACSGTDFYLMVAGLLGWRIFGRGQSFVRGVLVSLVVALPVAMLVNALRVVAVTQAHRWLIPLLPERHGAFAHMLTGVAVFLPSLIALNFALETYAKRHRPAA
jgi:exosortase/archaeosortase family protein